MNTIQFSNATVQHRDIPYQLENPFSRALDSTFGSQSLFFLYYFGPTELDT